MILGKTIQEWQREVPILADLMALRETMWLNPAKRDAASALTDCPLTMNDVLDAEARLRRFAPYFEAVFPETAQSNGLIESPLRELTNMAAELNKQPDTAFTGKLLLKCDSHLPISGSIKARGGIYEVLCRAEQLAMDAGLLTWEDNYAILTEPRFLSLFSRYSVAVGSTGNLGLSIGIMSAQLGFQVTVHMSADARRWKKDMLRSKGVRVMEYQDDYSKAVTEGRRQAESDPYCHFVDDENSKTLFLGYAVAALRLQKQLEEAGLAVDKAHPLFVYLPCGVGGGPGGVAFGLKQVFGDAVHCFFAEPTHAPCMILGMASGKHDAVCVQHFGIDNRTDADGLAVGRASRFVGKLMEPFLSGCYTITDEQLYRLLSTLADCEGIHLEPSALAGMIGPGLLCGSPLGQAYTQQEALPMEHATHIAWATGGSMVPAAYMQEYYQKGLRLREDSSPRSTSC